MTFDPQRYHRRSIRLKGYDYARAGAYFVTICAQHRELLFDPERVRTMMQRWWDQLPEKFSNTETDAFVVMPNHIHGIIVLTGADDIGGVGATGVSARIWGNHMGLPLRTAVMRGSTMRGPTM